MKTRNKMILTILITLLITLTIYNYWQKQKKYQEYANEKLNENFYRVCDYMMNSNVIIENIIGKGYVWEIDLEYLKNQYFFYLRGLDEINYISGKFYGFNFFNVDKSHNFNREYSEFYYRIDNLFKDREYDVYPTKRYQLKNSDLDVIRQSYEYTSKVVQIIKNHIEYYNMFDLVVIEDEATGRSQLKREYKEKYLEPWPDNRVGSAVEMSIKEDGTVTETPIEAPRYDYPKKPFIKVNDKEWINIHKEIYLINIEVI